MENDAAPTQGFNKQEPIPGYITKELLGTGGYGEVWKCHAPGGLFKAVKFIYAGANSKRAIGELRSLNRIKEVRHPFLLSIERIEVIDGNVVIVTELADQSLKRQFQRQRAKGSPGLPREELLGYLRDAADALDYIYDNYSLQHLDIKPENLLLVGNRAKVADFGLIKNLYDRSASMVEGLTPTYAPPELFEGKPNRHSDQYSLAIVYEEMLTGELPINGTTPAQLAAQHLHVAPALAALPRCDQPIIARALSKDPAQRFASCRALVDALLEAGKTKSQPNNETARVRQRSNPPPSAPCKTQDLGEEFVATAKPEATACVEPASVFQLPAIELDDHAALQYEPVLFVGIGGTATRVLRRLRRRLHDRLGAIDTMPAIEMLLIDTDVKSLNRATDGECGAALDGTEILPTPLRRSEDYRSAAGSILASISRRWLFNVPYSLETDGFRPLGRLALVDHSKRVLERLRQSLIRITSEESTAKTTEITGLEFVSRQPRVFIVSSIAGGTGSGMVLDVAYMVRSILAKLDLPDGNVHGILMHSTAQGQCGHDKAIANSYAMLSELWHYSRPGKCYPGDRGCGLPAFHGNNRTFSSCYFMHLGDDLTELQFDVATDPIAEYLYSSTMTPAAGFFDKCRQVENVRWGTELTEPILRTFGLCQLGGSNSEIPTIIGELLCRDLVNNWRGGMQADAGRTAAVLSITSVLPVPGEEIPHRRCTEIDSQAEAKAVELGVELEQMRNVARAILDQELSSDTESYFAKMIAEFQAKGDNNHGAQIVAAIDAALAGGDEAAFNSLNTVLNTRLEGIAAKLATSVCDWIFDLVDTAGGVTGAQHAAEWFQSHLRGLQMAMIATTNRLRENALACQHAILRADNNDRSSTLRIWPRKKQACANDADIRDYARVQIEQAVACSVTRWLRLVEAQVNAELERLQVFWKDLNSLVGKFHVSKSVDEAFEYCGGSDVVPSHWREVLGKLVDRRADLVATLDREIEKKVAVGAKKLRWFLTEAHPIDTELVVPLRAAARQVTLAAMQDLNISHLSGNDQGQVESPDYRHCLDAATPRLHDQAAGTRLLLIVPQDTDAATIRQSLATAHEQKATVVHSTEGDFIACQEAESLEVRRVAATLIDGRRDFVEVARRLHTRIDVNWDDMSLRCPKEQLVPTAVPLAACQLSEVAQ